MNHLLMYLNKISQAAKVNREAGIRILHQGIMLTLARVKSGISNKVGRGREMGEPGRAKKRVIETGRKRGREIGK